MTEYPDLLKYYDFESPDNPALETLRPTARTKVHWRCPDCGYRWEQSLHERIKRHNGKHRIASCPVCAGVSVVGINTNLSEDYPEIAEQWDAEANGKTLDGIQAYSTATYWWRCSLGHLYSMHTNEMVEYYKQGVNSCPYCDGRRIMPGFNSFKALYPHLMEEWDELSNSVLVDPDAVGPTSEETVWWNCHNGHTYPMRISKRVIFDYRGITACPQCKGIRKKKSHIYKR